MTTKLNTNEYQVLIFKNFIKRFKKNSGEIEVKIDNYFFLNVSLSFMKMIPSLRCHEDVRDLRGSPTSS